MSGRNEHEFRTNKNIEEILKNNSPNLRRYYLKIRVTKEPLTCLEYIRKINAFLNYINKDVNNIDIKDIDDYMNMIYYIKDNNGKERKSSSSYRQSVYAALNSFFGYLYSRGEIKENPMIDVPVVILVNENTASASEILSGALRDDCGYKVIGTKNKPTVGMI